MWKLPSPTCPTRKYDRPLASTSATLSLMQSARREMGTQVSVVTARQPGLVCSADR